MASCSLSALSGAPASSGSSPRPAPSCSASLGSSGSGRPAYFLLFSVSSLIQSVGIRAELRSSSMPPSLSCSVACRSAGNYKADSQCISMKVKVADLVKRSGAAVEQHPVHRHGVEREAEGEGGELSQRSRE